ncbi:hypothetical protein EUGRSUZ_F03970 [Eucalyptus grandis]|uniref:Uncharacterized protein n=2 Tax=Eucalyptus grandis TaxID=71139 RepID=A0ACC3KN70_EUCGR|nr:hypothetical protein EUGRSUZ_F03970 [Eucalyptus grandis]
MIELKLTNHCHAEKGSDLSSKVETFRSGLSSIRSSSGRRRWKLRIPKWVPPLLSRLRISRSGGFVGRLAAPIEFFFFATVDWSSDTDRFF